MVNYHRFYLSLKHQMSMIETSPTPFIYRLTAISCFPATRYTSLHCFPIPVLLRGVSALFLYGFMATNSHRNLKRWDSELSITNDDADTAHIRLGRSYSRSHQAKYIHLVS